MQKKKCKVCSQILTLKNFHRNSEAKGGYRNICKVCRQMTQKRKDDQKRTIPFFSIGIKRLMKHNRFKHVERFGFYYGVLILLRPKEVLAFSVVKSKGKASHVFESEKEARFFLYKQMIQAGEKTRIGFEKFGDRRVR